MAGLEGLRVGNAAAVSREDLIARLEQTGQIVVWSASRPRSASNSSTSRNESEYRRYQRTAQIISSGAVCRHLKISGRIVFFTISSGYQPAVRQSCNTSGAGARRDEMRDSMNRSIGKRRFWLNSRIVSFWLARSCERVETRR